MRRIIVTKIGALNDFRRNRFPCEGSWSGSGLGALGVGASAALVVQPQLRFFGHCDRAFSRRKRPLRLIRHLHRTGAAVAVTTERQRTANRDNARRSTGPRTASGKAKSSLNSIQHGAFASLRAIEYGPFREDQSMLDADTGETINALHPRDRAEYKQAGQVAAAYLKLDRVRRYADALLERDSRDSEAFATYRAGSFVSVDTLAENIRPCREWLEVLACSGVNGPAWLTDETVQALTNFMAHHATVAQAGGDSDQAVEIPVMNFTAPTQLGVLRQVASHYFETSEDAEDWATDFLGWCQDERDWLINKFSAEAADRWINGPMDKLTALEERLQRQLASAYRLYSELQARELPPDEPDA